jgi:mono/diheme cytochrome c family protein
MTLQFRIRTTLCALAMSAVTLAGAGCGPLHGRPGPPAKRPTQVLDFATLYKQNCAGCHGENGRNGAAIALSNPVYIALAGEARLRDTIANGVPGKLMPAFARSAGGMLTDQQVDALAHGIVAQWGRPRQLAGVTLPPYQAAAPGDAAEGFKAYGVFCARCHGANGEGGPANGEPLKPGAPQPAGGWLGSIVNPTYLSLISDQNLRSIVIAGRPDEDMPDWRGDAAQPMTGQQITDVVAWMASKRAAQPGQTQSETPMRRGPATPVNLGDR